MLERIRKRKELEATYRRLQWEVKSKRYKEDPMLWLRERMGENPDTIKWTNLPEYSIHIFDGSVDPLYNAWMDLSRKKWAAIESATGIGKTYVASRIINWFLDCFYNSLVVIIGPTTSQLKDNIWSELRTAHPKFKAIRPNSIIIENDFRVIDSNETKSWHAIMRSGAGDGKEDKASAKLSGFHRKDMLFVFDEMQGVSPSAIETIENTCTASNNLIIGFGNPDSKQDSLHKFCVRKEVSHYIASGLDHPNVVLDKELIPGAVTNQSIERRKDKYGETSPFYLSRVRGICPDSSMSDLFNLDAFDFICQNKVEFDSSYPAIGIDPANSSEGDDACVVYGLNNYCMSILSFKCPNCNMIADNLILTDEQVIKKHGELLCYNLHKMNKFDIKAEHIGVDSVGLGVGTINTFYNPYGLKVTPLNGGAAQDKDRIPKGVNNEGLLFEFGNLRAQMIWQLSDDVNNKRITLSSIDNPSLLQKVRDAMKETKIVEIRNKTYVTPKEDIKRRLGYSPNEFDALVYWNWTRNIKRRENEGCEIFAVDHV